MSERFAFQPAESGPFHGHVSSFTSLSSLGDLDGLRVMDCGALAGAVHASCVVIIISGSSSGGQV